MSDFDRKLLFVTGKGGVGKTTVSVAVARALSAAGRRVLLCLTESGRAASMLGVDELTPELRQLAPTLWAVALQPEAALHEYAEMTLKSRSLVHALLDNRYSRGFLAAVPGLFPWAVLGKAWFHSTESVDGRPRFDVTIVDAPATGHGLEMLRVPLVITQAAAPGVLKRDAERAWKMIQDPQHTGVVVVSLPEALPMQESQELLQGLAELGLSAQRLVLNARSQRLFSDAQAEELRSLGQRGLGAEAESVLDLALQDHQTQAAQAKVETALSQLGVPLTVLPFEPAAGTPAGISVLSRLLPV